MFAHDLFTSLFGALRPGELEHLTRLVRAALREGYGVVLNEPGTKKPLCVHTTAAARRKADREAYDEDMAAGAASPRRAHDCAIKGHTLTEADAGKVTKLIEKLTEHYGGTPNIGLNPGRSRLVAADMDTPEQRDAFLQAWQLADPLTVPDPATLYTVRSPGKKVGDVWEHSDGGHVWFTLPADFAIPEGKHVITDPEGKWSLIFGTNCQVLVPPSVREEGAYQLVGSPLPAPAWVLERIETETVMWAERRRIGDENAAARAASGELDPTDVAHHDDVLPWSAVLLERDWTDANRVDTCGCRIWTAPGPHASYKSATAHELGCSHPHYDDHSGHRPIHLWSDTVLPAAPRTLTKFAFMAWWDHDGDMGAASIALGLAVSDGGPMEVDNPFDLPELGNEQVTVEKNPKGTEPDPTYDQVAPPTPAVNDLGIDAKINTELSTGVDSSDVSMTDQPDDATKVTPGDTFAVVSQDEVDESSEDPPTPRPRKGTLQVYDSADLDDLPDPDPLIYGLLDRQSVAILSGKFGTYKSFLALDWACHVATGRDWEGHPVDEATPAVYIAAEGQVGVKRRVRGWRKRHLAGEHLPRGALTVVPQRVVLETDKNGKATAHLVELVGLVNELGAGLVVFDTLSKSKGKSDDNSNSEMSAIMTLVIELTRATGATVLLVAHTGYSGEHTRGASSQEDDVDTVFVIKFEDPRSEDRSMANRRVLTHRKSKDGDLIASMVLTPHVEELGLDKRGRPVTTLTLTTDPFVSEPKTDQGPRGALTESAAVAWFEDNPPPKMTRREVTPWAREQGLRGGSTATLWNAYKTVTGHGSTEPEPDDHGNHS